MKHILVFVMKAIVIASFAFLGFGLGGGCAILFPQSARGAIRVVVTLGFVICGLVCANGGSVASE